jgi:hypothetical protein
MPSSSLFRIGGIAAILSVIAYIVSLGAQFAGNPGGLGQPIYLVSTLLFLVALVVLYLELRSTAGLLALAGLILLGATSIYSFLIDPAQPSSAFGPLSLLYGLGFILFGWAQRGSDRYPNLVGLLALITGALAIIAGIALFAGASFDIFGLFNLLLSIPFVIWLAWLGKIWLTGRATAAQPA